MVTADFATALSRLVVILAAGFAAVPLIKRSTMRRPTCAAIGFGMVLALVPCALQFLHSLAQEHLGSSYAVLSRLDAPGFALILFGVVLALCDAARMKERLQKQNLTLKEEASTDFLTGLLNRRQADALLGYGAARARQSGDPLGFIMIDLDHFKRVNDTLGHQAGDAVLAHVAQVLKNSLRPNDIVSRYGGEEFLVVVSKSTSEGIFAVASELRKRVEQSPAEFAGKSVPVTASFGVAIGLVFTDESAKETIAKADAALYAAKNLGRNRVVSWEQVFREADESAKDLVRGAYAAKYLTARIA